MVDSSYGYGPFFRKTIPSCELPSVVSCDVRREKNNYSRTATYMQNTIENHRVYKSTFKEDSVQTTMRFSGGTLSLLFSATVVAASVFQNPAVVNPNNGVQRRSLFGLARASNGVLTNPNVVPRGGASDDEDDSEADVPEVLYLPGLLTSSVAKINVSCLQRLFFRQGKITFVADFSIFCMTSTGSEECIFR